jgi:hypothetical protein
VRPANFKPMRHRSRRIASLSRREYSRWFHKASQGKLRKETLWLNTQDMAQMWNMSTGIARRTVGSKPVTLRADFKRFGGK